MQIVPIDDIPPEFKNVMSSSWLWRYKLFTEELTGTTFLQQDSSKKVLAALYAAHWVDFPYWKFTIKKATVDQWKSINRPCYMWILATDAAHRMYLVHWILDNTLLSLDGLSELPNLIL